MNSKEKVDELESDLLASTEAIHRYRQFFAHLTFVLDGLRPLVEKSDIPKELGVDRIDELNSWNPKRIENAIPARSATPPAKPDEEEPIDEAFLRRCGFTFGHYWKNGFEYCELEAAENTITVSVPEHGKGWIQEEWMVGCERIPHSLMPCTYRQLTARDDAGFMGIR